jgi:S-(hydroxymethyl)glutathione dehydrogenase/alcohol dehydrogenase
MKAAVFNQVDAPLDIVDVEVADAGPHEVVVRLLASGVCHTDEAVRHGSYPLPPPMVLGHEGAGIVERVGASVENLRPGDQVISTASAACGRCWYCVRGEEHGCPRRPEFISAQNFIVRPDKRIGGIAGLGTFAEAMTVHEATLVKVQSDLPPDQLALIGCGVVTGFGAVLGTARVEAGAVVAVIGCGGVGQSAVQAAVLSGASQVIGVDPVPFKRDCALRAGATAVIDPAEDAVAAIKDLTDGRGADYAIEAGGTVTTCQLAMDVARPGGTTVIVGVAAPSDVLQIAPIRFLRDRKILKGSIAAGGSARKLIPMIVELAGSGRVDIASMVTKTIGLGDLPTAFGDMEAGRVTRSVIMY